MAHPGGPNPKLTGEKINEAAAYVEPLTEEHVSAATLYIQEYVDRQKVDTKSIDHYPTIEGLALKLDVARSTVYAWAEQSPEFAKVMARLLNKQAHLLQNLGLSKRYDSGMSRLLLSKHGYIQQTQNDGTIVFNAAGKSKGYMEDDGADTGQEG